LRRNKVCDYLPPNLALNDSGVSLRGFGKIHKACLWSKSILYAEQMTEEQISPVGGEVGAVAAHMLATVAGREVAHVIILSELVCCLL
jgi:hypothetical protein